jgi:PHD/YefM family antitoxin component YafN of YafNO toxin-antitoxin module
MAGDNFDYRLILGPAECVYRVLYSDGDAFMVGNGERAMNCIGAEEFRRTMHKLTDEFCDQMKAAHESREEASKRRRNDLLPSEGSGAA